MRVDFNLPRTVEGKISDDYRMRMALPSIVYILEQGGSLILMSHWGRPEGKKELAYSLAPLAEHLAVLLNRRVIMAPDSVGPTVQKLAHALQPGEILLLENLRFYRAEEHPTYDFSFAKALASLGDCYVNDAFGAAHRAHSSITEVAKYFPQAAAAGFLLEKEVVHLSALTQAPKKPFYAILGGAKISTKLTVLHSLLDEVDGLFIGGGMVFTLLQAQGKAVGNSLVEPACTEAAQELFALCTKKAVPIYLPEDFVLAAHLSEDAPTQLLSCKEPFPEGWMGVDIGPQTPSQWMRVLKNSATLFWNGPMGITEIASFARGTHLLAKEIGKLSCHRVVGGGDLVAAIHALHLEERFTHVSTGGGAALEWIEKKHLPGIDCLTRDAGEGSTG